MAEHQRGARGPEAVDMVDADRPRTDGVRMPLPLQRAGTLS